MNSHQNELFFELTLPPSVNHRTMPIRKNGKTVQILTSEYRKWKEQAEIFLRFKRPPGYSSEWCEDGVTCEITFSFPDKRRRDLDNYLKPLLDACTVAGLWRDDSLIRRLIIEKDEPKRNPEVKLRIYKWQPI